MDRQGQKGSITVFLSLVCILFLSLICVSVESARVQGAKAQSANIAGMGNFSLFAEFDRTVQYFFSGWNVWKRNLPDR